MTWWGVLGGVVLGAVVLALHEVLPPLFTSDALDLVSAATGGVPRVVNRLCDGALQRGYAVRTAVVGPDLMREAIADLQRTPTVPEMPAPRAERSTGASLAHTAPTRLYRPAPPPRSARPAVATAALVVLGGLSGLTLAVYWLWAGPMMTAGAALPDVRRPSMRVAAPLPVVLGPDIDAVGDPLDLPEPADADGEPRPRAAGAPRPVTAVPSAATQSLWAVQVGAFADGTRAASLVRDLSARGFTAFQSAGALRRGAPLHVVLVGPFAARTQAAAALDRIEEIPGIGRPTLHAVPPAAARR